MNPRNHAGSTRANTRVRNEPNPREHAGSNGDDPAPPIRSDVVSRVLDAFPGSELLGPEREVEPAGGYLVKVERPAGATALSRERCQSEFDLRGATTDAEADGIRARLAEVDAEKARVWESCER